MSDSKSREEIIQEAIPKVADALTQYFQLSDVLGLEVDPKYADQFNKYQKDISSESSSDKFRIEDFNIKDIADKIANVEDAFTTLTEPKTNGLQIKTRFGLGDALDEVANPLAKWSCS